MEQKQSFTEYPIGTWIFGIFLLAFGVFLYFTMPQQLIFCAIMGVAGLLCLFLPSVLTVSADPARRILTLSYQSLFRKNQKEFPYSEIAEVELERSSTRHHSSRGHTSGPSYRTVIRLQNGEVVPLHAYYASGGFNPSKRADQIRGWVGVGGMDQTPINLLKAASSMAADKFRAEQEEITGSQAETHVTNGVNWKLETITFGATPVNRWHSSDYNTQGDFIYIVQKLKGQKDSSMGGLLSSLASTLFVQSMNIYGFSEAEAPRRQQASLMPLEAPLSVHFSAYASMPDSAVAYLNTWVVNALSAWGEQHPLRQGTNDQLAVLIGPQGVHLAQLGLTNAEHLENLSALGAELVKSLKSGY